jgi:carboxypeptidase PM20D1
VTATTDSRHYAPLCDAVYRFAPAKLNADDLARNHGHDERISIENFAAGIEFYRSLIRTL